MSSEELAADGWLWLALEGGFVAAPGLSRPRRIELATVGNDERQRIAAMVAQCRSLHRRQAGAADQRFYRLVLGRAPDIPLDELRIDEADAPDALARLWADGVL